MQKMFLAAASTEPAEKAVKVPAQRDSTRRAIGKTKEMMAERG